MNKIREKANEKKLPHLETKAFSLFLFLYMFMYIFPQKL